MQSINRHVSLVFRMGERYLNRKLAGQGVSSGTGNLLLELRDGGDRKPTALAAAVGVNKSHITRSLQALKQAGHVVVIPDPADGRTLTVSLTKKGRIAAGLVEEAILSWIAIVNQGVSREDLATTAAVFDAFYTNAVEYFVVKPNSDTK
jgi:DNA-binding MarR family transcriptional regulator